MFTRRRFLLAGSTTTLAAASFPATSSAAETPPLRKGTTILFQGDSITDAGRNRKLGKKNDTKSLGSGYPLHIAGAILAANPALNLSIYNRGISGNKVPDLAKRWQTDCISLAPDILSILVGVNDIWHKLKGNYDGTPEDYRKGFTELLADTKKALPDTTLVVCEPFALKFKAVTDAWFPEMDTRRAIAKEVATEAGAIWIPLQQIFDKHTNAQTPPSYWLVDGVHPTAAGHALIAKTWREAVGI